MIFEKHLRYFIKNLFKFPSDAGFPSRVSYYRQIPQNYKEFLELVKQHHSTSPSFISLYQTGAQAVIKEAVIDKLWGDFDSINANDYSFKDLCVVADRLRNDFEVNIDDIFINYTGGKGYHIFCRNKPVKYTNDEIYYVMSYLTRDLEFADELHGDLNRLIRVPGPQREEKTFCISLDPGIIINEQRSFSEYFQDFGFDWRKIFKATTQFLVERAETMPSDEQKPDYIKSILTHIKSIGWQPTKQRYKIRYEDRTKNESRDVQEIVPQNDNEKVIDNLLKTLLPKSVYWGVNVPNPTERDRVALAAILMRKGLVVEDILMIIQTLRWIDFDVDISRKKLEGVKRRYID